MFYSPRDTEAGQASPMNGEKKRFSNFLTFPGKRSEHGLPTLLQQCHFLNFTHSYLKAAQYEHSPSLIGT